MLSVLIVLLTASAALAQQGRTRSAYVVGAICSLTGKDARIGISQREALLWVAEYTNAKGGINGHPLQVIVEDDASDGTMAVKGAKKLIELHLASALIGSSGTTASLAVIVNSTLLMVRASRGRWVIETK